MKWFRPNSDDSLIQEVARGIRSGELALLPTDTIYGLSANALDASAVAKVFHAKRRHDGKPLIVLCTDIPMVQSIVSEMPAEAQEMAKKHWPGPLTMVLPRYHLIPDIVSAGLATVAVRVPHCEVVRRIIAAAGVPVTSSSANLSGEEPVVRPEDAVVAFGTDLDWVVDVGELSGEPSTVVAFDNGVSVLRQGAVRL